MVTTTEGVNLVLGLIRKMVKYYKTKGTVECGVTVVCSLGQTQAQRLS